MKSIFSLSVCQQGMKVALVLSAVVALSAVSGAEAKSRWNPMNWVSSSANAAQEQNVEDAKLKAEEAARKAEEAANVAREAEKEAEKARQAVREAKLQKTAVKETPEPKEEQPETKAVKEEKADKKIEKAEEPKAGGWHLLNVFDKAADVKKEEARTESAEEPRPTETVATEQNAAKQQVAVLETEKGNVAFELYPDFAPQTVANFVELVNSGFYNKYNMKFHRVVPGFVVQTGDPTGTGAGGSKKTIPLESKNKLSHNAKGIVAMARGFDPNSATSQFYITLAPQTSLDGKYTIFGKVISGLAVLDKIEVGDMLYGIRMVDSTSVTRDPVEKKGFFSSLF